MSTINIPEIQNNDEATPELWNSKFATLVTLLNGNIDSDNLKDSAVTTGKIADDAVTGAKIADNTVARSNIVTSALFARVYSTTSAATLTPDMDSYDLNDITALAENITIAAPTGTPQNGQGVLIRIKDNATIRTITWNAIWRAVGVTLPTATVASKMIYIAARYNETAVKWDVLSIARET